MFTGIVEQLGTVVALEEQGDAVRLTVRGSEPLEDLKYGDSIAVNGCCLTVTDITESGFTADVMQETLDKTALGQLRPDAKVNLERAVTPHGRLDGHIVQGHVDGTGTIEQRIPSEHWEIVRISMPPGLARYVVPKGSIAVDGISLTVVEVADEPAGFTISLIPTTLQMTTLGHKTTGEQVNLEVDVIAKYVERLVNAKESS